MSYIKTVPDLAKKAFKSDKGKQIVDIVVEIKALKKNKKEIIAILLIENKITADPTEGQVVLQCAYTHSSLINSNKKVCKNIYSIYITPPGDKYQKEWRDFHNKYFRYSNSPSEKFKFIGRHLLWGGDKKTYPSDKMIRDLIRGSTSASPSKKEKHSTITGFLNELLLKDDSVNLVQDSKYLNQTLADSR